MPIIRRLILSSPLLLEPRSSNSTSFLRYPLRTTCGSLCHSVRTSNLKSLVKTLLTIMQAISRSRLPPKLEAPSRCTPTLMIPGPVKAPSQLGISTVQTAQPCSLYRPRTLTCTLKTQMLKRPGGMQSSPPDPMARHCRPNQVTQMLFGKLSLSMARLQEQFLIGRKAE